MDAFTKAYVTCALWSSMDDDDPMDSKYGVGDIADDALLQIKADCAKFQAENPVLFTPEYPGTIEQAGHDFWLTRNGHGAGFWDRGHGEVGEQLTASATSFGSCDLYVGDDGKLYV